MTLMNAILYDAFAIYNIPKFTPQSLQFLQRMTQDYLSERTKLK